MTCKPHAHERRVQLDPKRLHCPACGAYWTHEQETAAYFAHVTAVSDAEKRKTAITPGAMLGQFGKGLLYGSPLVVLALIAAI